MKYLVLAGRVLYSLIFLMTVTSVFTHPAAEHAASKGLPFASILVPLSGILAIAGGLSIALGYKAQWGAWLIIAFLIPVTLVMHAFWNESDPMQMHMQTSNFLKNVALIGAALLIAYYGSGPVSVDTMSKP
jgi:putative oxidoreductase